MIAVIVTYKVKPEFVEQNKRHIQQFLKDFKQLDTSGFEYNVYTKEDNLTFVHHSIYRDEKIQAEVLNVPSFKEFQRLRDESGLNDTHKVEVLNVIGSTNEGLFAK
jgi:quinol monooxygenase YgiN